MLKYIEHFLIDFLIKMLKNKNKTNGEINIILDDIYTKSNNLSEKIEEKIRGFYVTKRTNKQKIYK